MTDVDPPYRKAPTAALPPAVSSRIDAATQQLLEGTQEDFFHESLEILSDAANSPLMPSPGTAGERSGQGEGGRL